MFLVFIKAPKKSHVLFVVFLDPYCDCFKVCCSLSGRVVVILPFRPYRTMPTMLRLLEWDTRPVLSTFEIDVRQSMKKKSHMYSAFLSTF